MVDTKSKRYPQLSLAQQQALPELLKAIALPSMFKDSTHQLWQCDTVDGEMMLKVCINETVQTSLFWQGMALLFDVDLPKKLGGFSQNYHIISAISSLEIPDYIAASSVVEEHTAPAFILAKIVLGTMVDASHVDNEMLQALAQHISQLHHSQQVTWGSLIDAKLTAIQWPQRLQQTLRQLAENEEIADKLLAEALKQSSEISVKSFVPIMPDLRWDQFLQYDGKLSALVDLDAFVYGPRELELVLLEYLLDQQQAELFMRHYQQSHIMPDLSAVRTAYRLLLFLMNVLGERNSDIWMQSPTRF